MSQQYGLVFEEHEEEVSLDECGAYPQINYIDSVSNDPDSGLWHLLIESENYVALQYLQAGYKHKIDCIYIDPPYNTGDTKWKYNNKFKGKKDQYKHSYWLSMMKNRLLLAKELLNPEDSVLIVAIDEKEYLRLGLLLEQVFPEARIQMITTVIKKEGTNRLNEFSRTNEFIFFLMFGKAKPVSTKSTMFETDKSKKENVNETEKIEWKNFRRRGKESSRFYRPNQFYPIFINKATGFIESIGEALSPDTDKEDILSPDGCYALFPVSPAGEETMWGKHYKEARKLLDNGFLKTENGKNPKRAIIKYLPKGIIEDIKSGVISITGRGPQNEIQGIYRPNGKKVMPKTVWYLPEHNSQANGSLLLKKVIGENRFNYPKSLYAVADCLRFFVANKPDAVILDFFAGSGTTLHAVNLLNQQDNGHRKCIMVTNDESNIARDVMWPRTVHTIKGTDIDGKPLKGNYFEDVPMSDGFRSNAIFYSLKITHV